MSFYFFYPIGCAFAQPMLFYIATPGVKKYRLITMQL